MSRGSKQKNLILQILIDTTSHPEADWVYEQVKKEIPNISLGTVYRDLKKLAEEGKIQQLDIAGGTCRFDASTYNHYHFRCERCGRVLDVDIPEEFGLNTMVEQKTGLKVNSHRLEFRGLCLDCQNKM